MLFARKYCPFKSLKDPYRKLSVMWFYSPLIDLKKRKFDWPKSAAWIDNFPYQDLRTSITPLGKTSIKNFSLIENKFFLLWKHSKTRFLFKSLLNLNWNVQIFLLNISASFKLPPLDLLFHHFHSLPIPPNVYFIALRFYSWDWKPQFPHSLYFLWTHPKFKEDSGYFLITFTLLGVLMD